MKQLNTYIFIIAFFAMNAQEKGTELPRFSIRGNCGIPKVVSSEAFRNSFSGVVTADLSINCKLFSNFFIGVGYSYTYYKAQKLFRDQRVNTYMQAHNGFIKIGYDKFFSKTGFATFSLNAGYNFNQFSGIVYKNDSLKGKYPTNFTSSFVEPMVGLYFIVDPHFAIGAHLSYNYNFSQFNPKYSAFNTHFDYSTVKNNWSMSAINIGFGFYYGLVRK